RQRHVERIELKVRRFDGGAVEHDEYFAGDCCGPLGAVDERVIAGEAECEACGKIGKIRRGVAIGMQLLPPGQRGLQHAFVAHAIAAAMFRELPVVDGECEGPANPDDHGHVYCASLRSRERRLRITSSATSICAASS